MPRLLKTTALHHAGNGVVSEAEDEVAACLTLGSGNSFRTEHQPYASVPGLRDRVLHVGVV